MFNINNTEYTQVVEDGASRLAKNKIHLVKTDIPKIEIVETKTGGKKNTLKINFVGEEGKTHEVTIWEPSPEDAVRKTNANGKLSASGKEQTEAKIAQYLEIFAPEVWEKIKTGKLNIAEQTKTWAGLCNFVINAITAQNKKEAVTAELKLLSNSGGYAQEKQYILNLNKEGKPFASAWVGHNLSFSEYEQQQIAKSASAKPSSSAELELHTESSSTDTLDLDLDL